MRISEFMDCTFHWVTKGLVCEGALRSGEDIVKLGIDVADGLQWRIFGDVA